MKFLSIKTWFSKNVTENPTTFVGYARHALIELMLAVAAYFVFLGLFCVSSSALPVVLFLLALLLTTKSISIVNGIRFVVDLGGEFIRGLELLAQKKGYDNYRELFMATRLALLRRTPPNACYGVPFGIMDNKLTDPPEWLYCFIEERRLKWWLKHIRNLFYRVRSLIYLTAVITVAAPVDLLSTSSFCWSFAIACSFLVVILLLLMSSEIALGNIVMGRAHTDFLRGLAIREYKSPRAAPIVELLHLIWLAVLCGATSFSLLLGAVPGSYSELLCVSNNYVGRLERFVDLSYYAMTTLVTVGYGEIHPTTLWSRVLVGVFHLLGLMLIIFTVQVVVSKTEPAKHGIEAPS